MSIAPRFLAAAAASAALALGATACGSEKTVTQSSSDSSGATSEQVTTPPVGTTDTTPTRGTATVGAVLPISTDLSKKPKIPKPTGTPPKALVSKDIVVGTGAPVKPGQTATVQYVGASYSNGKEFDASWDRGQPFPFPLGGGQVIPGWDQGVAGMKVGGRRELVIPPDLGYGAQGSPPAIAPNETLVFVIDLKKIS